MEFPLYIPIGPLRIHPHFLFEILAYMIGFRLYLALRQKDRIPTEKAIWILTGAVVGAAAGSKILYWFEDPLETLHNMGNLVYLLQGKTIVGALLGGLIGVEWMKKRIGWTRRTGDDFAIPLAAGIAVGRIGCFLTGLPDRTYGTPTGLWTGVDFGDGIPRHPTQLYEIVFLLILMAVLVYMGKRNHPEGLLFQIWMTAYLLFRFGIEFIKPFPSLYFGLSHIQVAALIGVLYYIRVIRKTWSRWKGEVSHA